MTKSNINSQLQINPIKKSTFDLFLKSAINTKPTDDKKDNKKEKSEAKHVKKLKKQVA